MTFNYPKFNISAHCAKCGHDTVGVKYISYYETGNPAKVELLERTCIRCGFSWYEVPLA